MSRAGWGLSVYVVGNLTAATLYGLGLFGWAVAIMVAMLVAVLGICGREL